MTTITSSRSRKYEVPARRTTLRRRLATAALVASAVIVGGMGWRWVLVEATTDYGTAPDSIAAQPASVPITKHAPPPVGVEVIVLDVHTAHPPVPTVTPPKARPSTTSSRPRSQSSGAR